MKTEKIILGVFLLGFALKLAHIPGGSIFTVLTMTSLSLMYLLFGFYFLSDKKVDNKTVGFSIISGFLFSTVLMGILFKMMHWSGSMVILIVGFISCTPIAIISYLNYTKKEHEEQAGYYKNILIRLAVFLIFGLLSFIF